MPSVLRISLTVTLQCHQNKFHLGILKHLTQLFASMPAGRSISPEEDELLQYFANLYKNANKGIKGRGKERKITGYRRKDSGVGETHQDDLPTPYSTSSPVSHGLAAGFEVDQVEMDLDVEESFLRQRLPMKSYSSRGQDHVHSQAFPAARTHANATDPAQTMQGGYGFT